MRYLSCYNSETETQTVYGVAAGKPFKVTSYPWPNVPAELTPNPELTQMTDEEVIADMMALLPLSFGKDKI